MQRLHLVTIGALIGLTIAATSHARPGRSRLGRMTRTLSYDAQRILSTAHSEAGWGDHAARLVVNGIQNFTISSRHLAMNTQRMDPYSRQRAIQTYNSMVIQHRQVNYALMRARNMYRTRSQWQSITNQMLWIERELRRWNKGDAGHAVAEMSLPTEILDAAQQAQSTRFERLHAGL